MPERFVAGIFIERSKATLIVARYGGPDIHGPDPIFLKYTKEKVYEYDNSDQKSAISFINDVCELIGQKFKTNIASIAISCYGPFLSLNPKSDQYSTLNPEKCELPFRGINLYFEFSRFLQKYDVNENVKLSFWHDGNACALGESTLRKLPSDRVLSYLLVTEGVGVGFCTGNTINKSALHPEIGPLQVKYADKDFLIPDEDFRTDDPYAHSLSSLSDNPSLMKRYALRKGIENYKLINRAVLNKNCNRLFDFRGYYLAQACVAITIMIAPHIIVVGADIDPKKCINSDIEGHFSSFIKAREDEEAPLFDYKELNEVKNYISLPYNTSLLGLSSGIGVTGAVGMCAAAVRALVAGRRPSPIGGRNV